MCMRAARAGPVAGGDASRASRCPGTDQSADLTGWDSRAIAQIQGFPVARRLLEISQSVVARVPARVSVWSESCRPGASLPGARRDKNPGGLDRQDWHRQVLN